MSGSLAAPTRVERVTVGGAVARRRQSCSEAHQGAFRQHPPWNVSPFVLKMFQHTKQQREMCDGHSPTQFLHTAVFNILSYLFLSLLLNFAEVFESKLEISLHFIPKCFTVHLQNIRTLSSRTTRSPSHLTNQQFPNLTPRHLGVF